MDRWMNGLCMNGLLDGTVYDIFNLCNKEKLHNKVLYYYS